MKNVILVIFIAICCFVTACKDSPRSEVIIKDNTAHEAEDVKESIKKEGAAFEDAIRSADSNALAAFYVPGALVMAPNSEPISGTGIGGFWGSTIRMGIKDMKLTTTDIANEGNLVVETGNYEMFGPENKSLDKGKYIVVWKKDNGKWKIFRDMFSSNLPVQGAN